MGKRAKAGTCMAALVRLAVPLLKTAEHQCPRTGPGAKPQIPDWLMAALIMIAMLKQKKRKSAQYRFLCEERAAIASWLGDRRFPSRPPIFGATAGPSACTAPPSAFRARKPSPKG